MAQPRGGGFVHIAVRFQPGMHKLHVRPRWTRLQKDHDMVSEPKRLSSFWVLNSRVRNASV